MPPVAEQVNMAADGVARWVAAAREGDQDACSALVKHLHADVLRIARSHRPRRLDEEDLIQMVFARVFERLQQYSGDVPFSHWVSRVAVNTCLNALRAEQRRPEVRLADLSEDENAILDVLSADSREDADTGTAFAARELVAKLLQTLPPKDRLLITLLDLEGRTGAEVRAVTGWNEAVIKVRAFRARRKLRAQLEHLLKETKP